MKKRAVSDEQKQEKQLAILTTAADLFAESSFERLSMARIAETAGIAKGTIFLYFPTKEELFLALVEHSFTEWLPELRAGFDTLKPGRESPERVAELILGTLAGRRDLLRLLAILHTRIEENIVRRSEVRFRRNLAAGAGSIAVRLESIYPALGSIESRETVRGIYMLLIGVQQFAGPADFSTTFHRMCRDYLEGRLSRSAGAV
jgi:AcrR family transcriptional regulator